MNYRNLGRTGLKISDLFLGTMTCAWTGDEQTSNAITDHAFEQGVVVQIRLLNTRRYSHARKGANNAHA